MTNLHFYILETNFTFRGKTIYSALLRSNRRTIKFIAIYSGNILKSCKLEILTNFFFLIFDLKENSYKKSLIFQEKLV